MRHGPTTFHDVRGVGPVIKYLGSKRRLVTVLGELLSANRATTALDLFCGTTRVAQEFKRRGARVTAVDAARYAHVFAQCYVATPQEAVDPIALRTTIDELNALPGESGYVTEVFCNNARFFQPHNGARIDAIRAAIAREHAGTSLEPILLTSLIEAADRVDSTTGVQMAYVKTWAPRSAKPLALRVPDLLPGAGTAIRGDAHRLAATLGTFDLAYLDPPYNQHRYETNYHVWETLVAWDAPEHYGVACKRVDCRDPATKSVFNRKREMPAALCETIRAVDARLVVVSYNDESWMSVEELAEACAAHGDVAVFGFDQKRYVGAQIGIHDPSGHKVGTVSHLRNTEYVLVAGQSAAVEACRRALAPQRVAGGIGHVAVS